MSYFTPLRTSVCLAALVCGNAAFADVTAQEVWDNWKAQMSAYGENGVTVGSETMSGNTLQVTGLVMDMSDATTEVKSMIGDLSFTENGDGTVSVTMPDEYTITFGDAGATDQNGGAIVLNTSGLTLMVSGSADSMNYDMAADKYSFMLKDVKEAGEPVNVSGIVTLNGMAGNYTVTTADLRTIVYDLGSTSADISVTFDDDTGGFTMSGQTTDIKMAATIDMPLEMDAANPDNAFVDGLALDGNYTTGSANYVIGLTDASGKTDMTAASSGGAFSFGMNKDMFSLESGVDNLAVTATGGEIPFPVEFSVGKYGLAFAMPVSKTDAPADFSASFSLVDLAVNDMIWSMIDPTATLPHDPATAQIDLTGTGKWFYDILDPAQNEAMNAAAVPGEVNSVALKDLKLAIAGALVTGTGAFTFDNTDMTTFEGFPRPEGDLTLNGTGINGLMDKLVAMGIVPEDQMMGARMMMGMFATVTGDDQLTSKLVVNGEGQVLVNDQRIR